MKTARQAATSLGAISGDAHSVRNLIQEKLVSALRTVAATQTLHALNAKRRNGYSPMPSPNSDRFPWLDGGLRSQARELLEREGATPRGVRIIDELNKVYRRTGVLSQVTQLIGAWVSGALFFGGRLESHARVP